MKNINKKKTFVSKNVIFPIYSILIIVIFLIYLYFHRTALRMLNIIEYGLAVGCVIIVFYVILRLFLRRKKK